jgi:hypothetical protein
LNNLIFHSELTGFFKSKIREFKIKFFPYGRQRGAFRVVLRDFGALEQVGIYCEFWILKELGILMLAVIIRLY